MVGDCEYSEEIAETRAVDFAAKDVLGIIVNRTWGWKTNMILVHSICLNQCLFTVSFRFTRSLCAILLQRLRLLSVYPCAPLVLVRQIQYSTSGTGHIECDCKNTKLVADSSSWYDKVLH